MPKIYQTTLTALTLGVTLSSLGAYGTGAQAAPRAHTAARHAAHRRVPTPPDSYLQYKVYTVDQLIQQVSDNPVVRRRFARHFQLPEDRVVDYMRANLVESYIPKTGRYTVYCVRHSGKFYPVRQTFRQGTKVFALRNGEPVMKWVCGNPLTKFASTVTDVVSRKPVVKPMVAEFIPSDIENQVVPTEAAAPSVKVSPSIASLVTPVSSAVVGKGPSMAYGFLPALGLLGINHGHHTTPPVPIPEVPEPNGLLYLAIGLPITVIVFRSRRRPSKVDA